MTVTLSTSFWLSKVMTETVAKAGTRTMLAGTPGFQPPEQLQASALGIECDVYAVGAVLVVMFSEQPLWPSLTPFQIMERPKCSWTGAKHWASVYKMFSNH